MTGEISHVFGMGKKGRGYEGLWNIGALGKGVPKQKTQHIPDPDPSPTPVMSDEIQSAKSKVRKRKIGRRRNILAGRMMAGRRDILNTFNTKLGE